jgi:hypothetical protein
MEIAHALSLERHSSIKHGEEHHTSTPKINVQTVALISEDFRSYICRSSALFTHLGAVDRLLRDTKVSNFDISFTIK